jgi:signal transduction histidine kinase
LKRYQGVPLYLIILCGLILLLLSMNGLLEFRRTQQGLWKILEGQGLAYLDSREKEIKAIIAQLSALKENQQAANPPLPSPYGDLLSLDSAIAEHLLDVALDLDRQEKEGRLSPPQVSSLMKGERLNRVEFWDLAGNLRSLQGEGSAPLSGAIRQALIQEKRTIVLDDFLSGKSLRPSYTLGIRRRYGQGILLLSLDGRQMQSLRLRWLLEGSREGQGFESGLRYLIWQGEDSLFLASGEPFAFEESQADPFLREAMGGKGPRSRIFQTPSGEEVYEVVKPLSLGQQEPTLLRAGLSLEATRAILSQLKASIILQLSLSMALALFATLIVFWMQNRHLLRVREMEEKVRIAERLSSLGQLAAGLAHEIRNPLNAISIGIQRLKREFGESLSSREAMDLLGVISGEIGRLDSLVDRFLRLTRPDRIVRGEGYLGKIISDLLQLLADEAKESGIQMRPLIAPDLPPIAMDQERMKEAFLNLIKNAMEAMKEGGILQVEAHPLDARSVQITFSDSGCGIPASEQHKVFDPYYTSKEHGLGLGLSLAYQIIKAHGGEIQIESEAGRGTRVRVILPVEASG